MVRRNSPDYPRILMADHGTPHFHNTPGVPKVLVRVKEFMCIGALPPFDHPHIFIDMGGDAEAVCAYCSTRFVYAPDLPTDCEPAGCIWHGEGEKAA
jgi:uncharacterized Zn-finger protein